VPSLAPRGAGGQYKERTETARGQASARPENPRAVLLAMPEGHPYRALAEGAYRPAHAADDERWELARRGAERILAADAPLAEDDRGYVASERNALCALCYWAARDGEEALCPDALLDEATIQRFVADDGPTRRASHRSRVALASSVRRFRRAFPELFPQRRRPSEADPVLAPLEDWQFDAAWEETRGFRSAETRLNLRAMLLLGRGAGLDGAEMCFASGADVRHEPAAGTWVVVRRPGREREVPVLARYGPLLEDLAHARKERCLVADVPAPCNSSQPGQLARVLSRALARHGRGFKVSPEMLRKAWLVEHVAANVPVPSLLAAAGLGSLRTLERLLPYAPRPPSSKAHFAYELGGVENRQARRARRGE
jgi:hypothetical protein